MSKQSETGHAKNVANFESFLTMIDNLGTAFNPTKDALKLTQLTSLSENAKTEMQTVTSKLVDFNNATNSRKLIFATLPSLIPRVVNALEVSGANDETIQDAFAIKRKLQGRRAKNASEKATPETPAPKIKSSSQQSFDLKIDYFNKLIELLKGEITYSPNEVALKITTLNSLLFDLKTANLAVATTSSALALARIARNKVLYGDTPGLVNTARETKKYIKSIFGAKSAEAAATKQFKFRSVKVPKVTT